MDYETLDTATWQARASAHATRVDALVADHLARRSAGVSHPVHDFLFTYYSHRPAQLRRWHPGYGVTLVDAEPGRGYEVVGTTRPGAFSGTRGVTVSRGYVASQRPLLSSLRTLLAATADRPAQLGCFGLHEWAMVYRADENRHDRPLRLGRGGTDAVVEQHRIACSHFDAFRFFTDEARPLNRLQPGPDDRSAYEQPGCLHAGMDLYKHAFRLSPMIASELVVDCFELARDIRVLDMRAAPYDLSGLGYSPVRIETPEGKREYAEAQRGFAERGAPLRSRLLEACTRLLAVATSGDPVTSAGRPSPHDGA